MTGNDGYEFFYEMDEDNTRRFLARLRIEYGPEDELIELLKKAFGSDNGITLFTEFCKRNHIKHRLISM